MVNRFVVLRIILVLFIWLWTLTGCSDHQKSPVIAVVNGSQVTRKAFDSYLKFKRVAVKDDKKKNQLLDQYLEREALSTLIADQKVLDMDMIEAELTQFKQEMLISRYFETFLNQKVTDQAIENYYKTHSREFEQEKAHVAHILIRLNPKMSEIERKAKLTKAQEAYSKLKTGEPFDNMAKLYSEDKISAVKGGDLGWIKKGAIDQRFSEKAFALKPNEISQPFETPFGFHIIKMIEGPSVVMTPFETAKGNIRYKLRALAKQEEMKRLMQLVKIERKG